MPCNGRAIRHLPTPRREIRPCTGRLHRPRTRAPHGLPPCSCGRQRNDRPFFRHHSFRSEGMQSSGISSILANHSANRRDRLCPAATVASARRHAPAAFADLSDAPPVRRPAMLQQISTVPPIRRPTTAAGIRPVDPQKLRSTEVPVPTVSFIHLRRSAGIFRPQLPPTSGAPRCRPARKIRTAPPPLLSDTLPHDLE